MEGQYSFRGEPATTLQNFSASLLFADDVVLLASSDCNLRQFVAECDRVEIKISTSKIPRDGCFSRIKWNTLWGKRGAAASSEGIQVSWGFIWE